MITLKMADVGSARLSFSSEAPPPPPVSNGMGGGCVGVGVGDFSREEPEASAAQGYLKDESLPDRGAAPPSRRRSSAQRRRATTRDEDQLRRWWWWWWWGGCTNDLTAVSDSQARLLRTSTHIKCQANMLSRSLGNCRRAARVLRNPAETGPGKINPQRQWKQLHMYC